MTNNEKIIDAMTIVFTPIPDYGKTDFKTDAFNSI
jgi:hypothetical protein